MAAARLLRAPPKDGRAEFLLGIAAEHENAGELELAHDVAIKALQPQAFSEHLPMLLLAGRVCARMGSGSSESVIVSERALHAARTTEPLMQSTVDEAAHVLAVNLLLRSRAEAEPQLRTKALDRAVEVFSAISGSSLAGARADYSLALAESQHEEEALGAAKAALEAGGDAIPHTWAIIALLLSAQRRYGDAEEMCRLGAVAVPWPESSSLHVLRARIQAHAGEHGRAAETLKVLMLRVQSEGSERRKQDQGLTEPQVWLELASVYIAARRFSDATACLSKAQALEESPLLWRTMGHLHEERSEAEPAIQAFSRAVDLGDMGNTSRVHLAAALLDLGGDHIHLARAHLSEALRCDPLDHEAWFQMGIALRSNSELESAAECFKKSRMLGAKSPVAPYRSIVPTLSSKVGVLAL